MSRSLSTWAGRRAQRALVAFVVVLLVAGNLGPAAADEAAPTTFGYVFTPIVDEPTQFTYHVTSGVLGVGGQEPDRNDSVLQAIAGVRVEDGVPVSVGFAYYAGSNADSAPSAFVNGERYGCSTPHCTDSTTEFGLLTTYGTYTPASSDEAITHVLLVVDGGVGLPDVSFNDDEWRVDEAELDFAAALPSDEDVVVYAPSRPPLWRDAVTVTTSTVSIDGGTNGSVAIADPYCGNNQGVAVGVGSMTLAGGLAGPITRECPYSSEQVVGGVNGGIAGLDQMFVEGNRKMTDVAAESTTWSIGPSDAAAAGLGRQQSRMVVIDVPDLLAPTPNSAL